MAAAPPGGKIPRPSCAAAAGPLGGRGRAAAGGRPADRRRRVAAGRGGLAGITSGRRRGAPGRGQRPTRGEVANSPPAPAQAEGGQAHNRGQPVRHVTPTAWRTRPHLYRQARSLAQPRTWSRLARHLSDLARHRARPAVPQRLHRRGPHHRRTRRPGRAAAGRNLRQFPGGPVDGTGVASNTTNAGAAAGAEFRTPARARPAAAGEQVRDAT